MSSLQVQLSEKAKLIEEIANQFGEYEEGQLQKLEELDITIPAKIDAWSLFIKETIPEEVQRFKNKIEEYREGIKKLEEYKEKKELYLNNLIKENGCGELIGEEKRIVLDLSVRRSVDETKINKEDGYYIYSGKVPIKFVWLVDQCLDRIYANEGLENVQDLFEKVQIVGVTDLPEDHPAIVKSIRPTIKILLNKGKK